MANPAPIIQTFYVEDEIFNDVKLDGVVTLVDAKHVRLHLDVVKPEGYVNEAVEQIAYADRIIVNKVFELLFQPNFVVDACSTNFSMYSSSSTYRASWKNVCILLQTDLVGEPELGSVMQRLKVGSASSVLSFSLNIYFLRSALTLSSDHKQHGSHEADKVWEG